MGLEEVSALCRSGATGLVLCAPDPPRDPGTKVRACFAGTVGLFQRWEWGARRGSTTFPGSPRGTGNSRMRPPTPGVRPHSLEHTARQGPRPGQALPLSYGPRAQSSVSHPQRPTGASSEDSPPR